ncbi:MAG: hypothetical protein PHN45_00310, partial [Methylococcales bacterium]|nr:hypothetical protein [Methylococcales bacterium]
MQRFTYEKNPNYLFLKNLPIGNVYPRSEVVWNENKRSHEAYMQYVADKIQSLKQIIEAGRPAVMPVSSLSNAALLQQEIVQNNWDKDIYNEYKRYYDDELKYLQDHAFVAGDYYGARTILQPTQPTHPIPLDQPPYFSPSVLTIPALQTYLTEMDTTGSAELMIEEPLRIQTPQNVQQQMIEQHAAHQEVPQAVELVIPVQNVTPGVADVPLLPAPSPPLSPTQPPQPPQPPQPVGAGWDANDASGRNFRARRQKNDKYQVRNEWTVPRMMLYPSCMSDGNDKPSCRGGYHNIPWDKTLGGPNDTECDFRLIRVPQSHELRDDFKQYYKEYRKRSTDVQIILQLSRSRVRFAAGSTQLSQYSTCALTRHFFPFYGYRSVYSVDTLHRIDVVDYNQDLTNPDARLLINPTTIVFTRGVDARIALGDRIPTVTWTVQNIKTLEDSVYAWYLPHVGSFEYISDQYGNHAGIPTSVVTPNGRLHVARVEGVECNCPLLLSNVTERLVVSDERLISATGEDVFYTSGDVIKYDGKNAYCNRPFFEPSPDTSHGVKPNPEYIHPKFITADKYVVQSSRGIGLVMTAVNHLKTASKLYYLKMTTLLSQLAGATNIITTIGGHHHPSTFDRGAVTKAMHKNVVSLINDFDHNMMCHVLLYSVKQMDTTLDIGKTFHVDVKHYMTEDDDKLFAYVVLVESLIQCERHTKLQPKRERTRMRKAYGNSDDMLRIFIDRLVDIYTIWSLYMTRGTVFRELVDDNTFRDIDDNVNIVIGDVRHILHDWYKVPQLMDSLYGSTPLDVAIMEYKQLWNDFATVASTSNATNAKLMGLNIDPDNRLSNIKSKLAWLTGEGIPNICLLWTMYLNDPKYASTVHVGETDTFVMQFLNRGQYDLSVKELNM